jgi:hypothetical protein
MFMKPIYVLIVLALLFTSCKNNTSTQDEVHDVEKQEIAYASFGDEITDTDPLSAAQMTEVYNNLKAGDTIHTKVIAKVEEVCQSKGCWMRLNLDDDKEIMVKFKDYGFFMPKNIAGMEVIVNGKAFVNEMSVEELRHYAEDAGKATEEIAAITEPKRTYSFEADGVLIKQ